MEPSTAGRPLTREEWEARLDQQDTWDIYFRDERWGSVTLAGGQIVIEGPKQDAIRNVVESMRRDLDDTALFRSLPRRLTGHVFAAFPEEV